MSDLTKIILDLIKERGTTKAKVERDCGFGNGTIGRWEKGLNNPSETAIEKLSNYFGVSIQYTISDEKKDRPEGQPLSELFSGLSEDELSKVIEYVDFLKSKRNS